MFFPLYTVAVGVVLQMSRVSPHEHLKAGCSKKFPDNSCFQLSSSSSPPVRLHKPLILNPETLKPATLRVPDSPSPAAGLRPAQHFRWKQNFGEGCFCLSPMGLSVGSREIFTFPLLT